MFGIISVGRIYVLVVLNEVCDGFVDFEFDGWLGVRWRGCLGVKFEYFV